MKIWINKYEQSISHARAGWYIKVQVNKTCGYSCLQLWPDFGDSECVTKNSELLQRSIEVAVLDAQARANNLSLLSDLEIENNSLVTDLASITEIEKKISKGFRTFKLKIGRNIKGEINWIKNFIQYFKNSGLKIRLDANSKFSIDDFLLFMKSIPESADNSIEYVEDPVPFDSSDWKTIRKRWPVAIDFELRRGIFEAVDVLIYKPIRQKFNFKDLFLNFPKLKVTVTSAMDPQIGVLWALAQAQELKKLYPQRSLVSGIEIEQNPIYFSEIFKDKKVMGLGCDQEMHELHWVPYNGESLCCN